MYNKKERKKENIVSWSFKYTVMLWQRVQCDCVYVKLYE